MGDVQDMVDSMEVFYIIPKFVKACKYDNVHLPPKVMWEMVGGFVITKNGDRKFLNVGDWIVYFPNGDIEIYNQEDFTNKFKPVNQ